MVVRIPRVGTISNQLDVRNARGTKESVGWSIG